MRCPQCHKEIADLAKFCSECGTRLSEVSGISQGDFSLLHGRRTIPAAGNVPRAPQPAPTLVTGTIDQLATREAVSAGASSGTAGRLAGARLSDRYEILKQLGEGGFARVVLAEDRKLGRQVAIKRLKGTSSGDPAHEQSLKRFLQESQAVACLNHRNIVQVFDADHDEEGPYIVMEYVDGPTLREYLRQKERLDLPVALQLFQGIAQGVAFSHRHNIIHRDLKPANILLASETGGESGRLLPKIVDFGLARIGGDSGLSQSGYGMGTQGYMPPEQRRDAKSVNHTADIYALGKILYELVSGAGPDDVLPSKIPPPPTLARVIFRCIEDKPAERYFSVGDLLDDLSRALEQPSPAVSGDLFEGNICPSCQLRNRDGVKFCVSCGAGLTCPCPECECDHPVSRPFCGECGTEVKAFLSVRDIAQKMRAYSDDKKWSRVAKEYALVPEKARLPGAKGQELLAEIKALNEAATVALRRRDELLSAIAAAMAERNYTAAARAVTECLEIAPGDAAAREARERLDALTAQAEATAAELEAAIASGQWRHALQLAEAAKHDFPYSEALAELRRKAAAGAAAEKKNVDDFVAGVSVAQTMYDEHKLVSGGRQLAQMRTLRDSIGDIGDSACAPRMQSALESLVKLEKAYSAAAADYAALLAAAQEKLAQCDYDACSALCAEAHALNAEDVVAEELGKKAAAEKKNVDDFVAGVSVARALYEERKLVSGNRQLALLRTLRDSIGDIGDSACAPRMQSALESLAELEKAYSAAAADYAALLTAAQEKLAQYDYDACSALCADAYALNVEGAEAEEMGKTAVENKNAVAESLQKARLALVVQRWTEAEAACQTLLAGHQGHAEAEQLLLHCQEKMLARRRKMKCLVLIAIAFLALLAVDFNLLLIQQRAARIEAHLVAARAAMTKEDWLAATAAAEKALALDADNAVAKALKMRAAIEPHLVTARTAMAERDWSAATAAVDKALALDAGNAEAQQLKANVDAALIESHLATARAAKTKEDWAAVMTAADKVLALDADNAEAKGFLAESSRHLRVPEGFHLAPGAGPEPYTNTGWVSAIIHEKSGIKLLYIPAGSFTMGSPTTETNRDNDETRHQVTIPQGFYLGETEVTQAQWEKVMKENPSYFQNAGANAPVEQVSWDMCQGFCRAAGSGLRLPLEAEWEYACRAGTTTAFHYGDSLDATMANFDGNYPYGGGKKGEYRWTTIAVRQFKPNAWGLYDMHGNVWEWCQDKFEKYPSGSVMLAQPAGPVGREEGDGAVRVIRGGGWGDFAGFCRSAGRSGGRPDVRNYLLGFRVVRSAPPVQ